MRKESKLPDLTPQEFARGCLLRIVAQPGRYNQETWQTVAADDVDFGSRSSTNVSCATTGCVAGTVAMLAGDVGIVQRNGKFTRGGTDFYDINTVISETGRRHNIRQRGQDLLELSERDAYWLFAGTRKLPEVVNALIELSESREITRREVSDMTQEERDGLMKYRVPKIVKRQNVPAQPNAPQNASVGVHHADR